MIEVKTHRKLFLFTLLIFIFWATRAFTFSPFTESLPNPYYSFLLSTFFFYSLMVLPAYMYLKLILKEKYTFQYINFVFPHSRNQFIVTMITMTIWFLILYKLYPLKNTTNVELLLLIIKSPWACIAEEILFRGLIFKELQKNFSFVKSNLIQAFLFMGIHFYWIFSRPADVALLFDFITILILGLLFGLTTKINKSIIPSIIWHTINNIFAYLMI